MVDRQSKIKVSQNLSPVFEESRRSRNSCRNKTSNFHAVVLFCLFICLFVCFLKVKEDMRYAS